jgi:hypothetical protein
MSAAMDGKCGLCWCGIFTPICGEAGTGDIGKGVPIGVAEYMLCGEGLMDRRKRSSGVTVRCERLSARGDRLLGGLSWFGGPRNGELGYMREVAAECGVPGGARLFVSGLGARSWGERFCTGELKPDAYAKSKTGPKPAGE